MDISNIITAEISALPDKATSEKTDSVPDKSAAAEPNQDETSPPGSPGDAAALPLTKIRFTASGSPSLTSKTAEAVPSKSVFEDPDVDETTLLIWFFGTPITSEHLEIVVPAFLKSRKVRSPIAITKSTRRDDVVRVLFDSAVDCPKKIRGEFQFVHKEKKYRLYTGKTIRIMNSESSTKKLDSLAKTASVQNLNPENAGVVVISTKKTSEPPPKVQTSAQMQGTKIRFRRSKVTDVGPALMPTIDTINCYCDSKAVSPEVIGNWSDLKCSKCHAFYHGRCTQQTAQKPLLPGDIYYTFMCKKCGSDTELFAKQAKSWPQVLQISFYNLTSVKRGGRTDPPDDNLEYFSLEDLAAFITTNRHLLAIKDSIQVTAMLLQEKLKEQPLFFANKESLWAFNKAHLHPGSYSFVPSEASNFGLSSSSHLVTIDVNSTSNDFLPNPAAYSTQIEPMKVSTPLIEIFGPGAERPKLSELRNQLANRLQPVTGTVSSTNQVVSTRVQPPIVVSTAPSQPPAAASINMYKPGMLVPYMPFAPQLMQYPPEMLQHMQMSMGPLYPATPMLADKREFEDISSILASAQQAMVPSSVPFHAFGKGTVNGYNTRRRERGNSGRETRRSKENNNDKEKDNGSNSSHHGSNGSSSGSGGNNNNNNNNNGRDNGHNHITEIDDDEVEEEPEEKSAPLPTNNKRKRSSHETVKPTVIDTRAESDNEEEIPPVKKPRITNIPQTTPHITVDPISSSESRATNVMRDNTSTSTFAVGSPVPMPVPKRSTTPTPPPPTAPSPKVTSVPQMDNDNITDVEEVLGVKVVASKLFFYVRWRIPPGVSESDMECFYSFLPAEVLNQLAPQKVIQFYQSRIQFDKNVFGTLPSSGK